MLIKVNEPLAARGVELLRRSEQLVNGGNASDHDAAEGTT